MQKISITKPILFSLSIFFCYLSTVGQTSETYNIDLQKERIVIEKLDKQFSKYYFNGDSVAIAAMYAKDATLGCLKGKEILSYWGRTIRNSMQDNTRTLVFKTSSLSSDSGFLVELGDFEIMDDKDELKGKGKYLVVWKKEDGIWKLYRDMSL